MSLSWDIATPNGSEDKSQGAGRIRDMKAAMQNALQAGGTFPGADLTAPIYYTVIGSGVTGVRPAPDANYAGRWFFNRDTGCIERDTGTAWEVLTPPLAVLPAGTNLIFFEAAAPSGWTQITSGIGDRLMRVVTSGGGTATAGNSVASPPTHDHSGLTTNGDYTHGHGLTVTSQAVKTGSDVSALSDVTVITALLGLGHTHTLSAVAGYSPKYIDAIVCSKD